MGKLFEDNSEDGNAKGGRREIVGNYLIIDLSVINLSLTINGHLDGR